MRLPSPAAALPSVVVVVVAACAPPPAADAVGADDAGADDPRPDGGRPDGDDAGPPRTTLAVNEIECRAPTFVELFNPTDAPIALAGHALIDGSGDPARRVALSGAVPPRGFVSTDAAALGLACATGVVRLVDDGGQIVDEAAVGAPGVGRTWGRLPDGASTFVVTTPTRDLPNAAASAWRVRLNEVDCRGREWIEITSLDDGVDLTGWSVGTDADGDGAWTLPAGASVGGGGRYVVDESVDGGAGYPFGVACGAEPVVLFDALGEIVDVAPALLVPVDASVGRLPDGTGAWGPTTRTRGAPNQPWSDPSAALFDPRGVSIVDVGLSQAAQDALMEQPYVWTTGTFKHTGPDGASSAMLTVGVRLKGKLGSFRPLGDKSAFKIDFDRVVDEQTYLALERLNLNNMVQDASAQHEHLSYALFRAAGVPAPRVGYARVRVNGEDYGLYATIEPYDDVFLDARWPETAHLYEGQYGDDLFPSTVFNFDVDEGDPLDRSDLEGFINAVAAAPDQGFMAALDPLVDWDQVLATMAVEMLTGHWDGYAPTRNNYFFHVDGDGVFRMLPWGTDQTFDAHWPLFDGQGLLLQRCLVDAPCFARWSDELARVADVAAGLDLAQDVADISALLQPIADEDPKTDWPDSLRARGDAAIAYLTARIAEIRDAVACDDADVDGDLAVCAADCAEGDPAVRVGAVDACGDGIDQDCSGRADDAAGCDDCAAVGNGERDYLLCWRGRDFAAARALCQARGMDLVVIGDQAETDFLVGAIAAQAIGWAWIGLSDDDLEGTFAWVDGSPLGYAAWNGAEPNDYGGNEDCAHVLDDGAWNDLPCSAAIASICEER